MPRVFDNIELELLPALRDTLGISQRGDFCVGYFNLRGWKQIDDLVEAWSGGDGSNCRLLVGMQVLPEDELREALSLAASVEALDNQTALRLKKRVAEEFRQQLQFGSPTNADETGLRRLASQIRKQKIVVKLYLRHRLHAKLYLAHRTDPNNPITGFVGSSNLTFAGLSAQGELNVDVLDHDACEKLSKWFEDRWNDHWCVDISEELAEIIDASWARSQPLPPYWVYLKMAYHLSQEARAGLTEFTIPREFGDQLLDFQTAAVKIAAHHLNTRGGVVIGDVVGLGKTLMATAVARIFQDDHYTDTLILCPKNLVSMWEDYVHRYRLFAKVMSITSVLSELPDLRRFRVVLIDESHNLRNREGKRYRAIREYIETNESKCILLTATPYNKTYLDLSSQLRLFIAEDMDLGIRPERILKELGETEFIRQHQAPLRSLAAFEKSHYPDDWRDLMRLFLVRRTRTFIVENYAKTDEELDRKYLEFADGTRFYFPVRHPKTAQFEIGATDQYAKLLQDDVLDAINGLNLPRYGLGNYIAPTPHDPPTAAEQKTLQGLGRAGKRLMGFSRTNLFKRLESGGPAFIQSVERHILRNFVYLHAIESNLDLPLGTQSAELLDSDKDPDADGLGLFGMDESATEVSEEEATKAAQGARGENEFRIRASSIYEAYRNRSGSTFKWLRPSLFVGDLEKDLLTDAQALIGILNKCGVWEPTADSKLSALYELLSETHPDEKVLVFTQFADTVDYLVAGLKNRGLTSVEGVTGDTPDPTALAWRFSPRSNDKENSISEEEQIRVLVSTDVLSEGQNLQDSAIVVNYDLPWAIIRLIQRAGRVDRIGQRSPDIIAYSFLPTEGVERIIQLRDRVRRRLKENAEVVGTDEAFFEDEFGTQPLIDLYNENAGILDGELETEVDLASLAFQIWKNAIEIDPRLEQLISDLPNVVYATREHPPTDNDPEGILLYLRTADGNDALARVDKTGALVSESQLAILKAAECTPEEPATPRHDLHHDLVQQAAEHVAKEEKQIGGQLGRPSGARFRTYERLKAYAETVQGTLLETQGLLRAIDEIYRYPLRQSATDTLNRQLRSGIDDQQLAELVVALREDERLCLIQESEQASEPQIICSMGLFGSQ